MYLRVLCVYLAVPFVYLAACCVCHPALGTPAHNIYIERESEGVSEGESERECVREIDGCVCVCVCV